MLIDGDKAIDERGVVSFVNDFTFDDVERFYVIQNHQPLTIRGWHGHDLEAKYVYVVSGAARIAWVEMNNPKAKPEIITMMGTKPQVLHIPPGYYNASQTLVTGTKIIYFSTSTLQESKLDDKRLPLNKWREIWS